MKLFITPLLLLLFTLPIAGTSQISVSNTAPYDSEQYLVEDILLGNGVSASNITFSGEPTQIGFFNGVSSNIGLDSGIVMSSGNIADIDSPSSGFSSTDVGGNGDADLLAIAQINRPNITSTADAALLEFDFFVTGDTVEFQFVFASEEYMDYINTDFNDAFGFFLSGPEIVGPYSSPTQFPDGSVNVALVPGTTTPISISTIYNDITETPPSMNGQFFINNVGGTTHVFNGSTSVITAKYPVICGEEYHFKFAIGDSQDGGYDSGVFLGARSLGSEGLSVSSYANFAGVQGNTIGEACGQAGFVFSSSNVNEPDTIRFTISGNADMFDDYLSFPDSIILPVGVASDTIWVTILQDYVFEDMDTLEVTLLDVVGCNTATLYIQNINQLNASLTVDSLNICPPETGQLVTEIFGGWEPYYVAWNNNGGIGDTVLVSPDITTFYNAIVTDACGSVRILESSEVWIQCPVAIANVFTPNGDGMNDFYSAVNLDDYPQPTITIYNRWGKIVYYMEDYQNDWDGTHYKSGEDLKEGVYYIIVSPNSPKYQYTEHEDPTIQRTLSGYLQLMR